MSHRVEPSENGGGRYAYSNQPAQVYGAEEESADEQAVLVAARSRSKDSDPSTRRLLPGFQLSRQVERLLWVTALALSILFFSTNTGAAGPVVPAGPCSTSLAAPAPPPAQTAAPKKAPAAPPQAPSTSAAPATTARAAPAAPVVPVDPNCVLPQPQRKPATAAELAPKQPNEAEVARLKKLRLSIVTVTSQRYLRSRALKVEPLILKRASKTDRIAYVCRHACAERGRSFMRNMIEFPENISTPDVDNTPWTLATCWRNKDNRACNDYEIGALKFVYGLIFEVRRFLQAGVPPAEMPQYWMVKDDDVFVHIPNLLEVVGRHSVDPLREKLIFGALCPHLCGGAGWVLTGGLAIELATTFGDRYMRFQLHQSHIGSKYHDVHMPKVLKCVPGAKVVNIWEMQYIPPTDGRCRGSHSNCFVTPECPCSGVQKPATWHMSGNFNKSFELLSRVP